MNLPFAHDQGSADLALGCMTFGAQVDREEAERMVGIARDAGVVMFDTANSYAGGASEEILGDISHSIRDEVFIATKVGSRSATTSATRLDKRSIVEHAETSLKRLRTDVIDLYYLHMPDRHVAVDETLEAMNELVESGKVRHVGQSNYPAWEIAKMRCISERKGLQPIAVTQVMYNLLARRIEDEFAECINEFGMRNVVYNPVAGGLLTGKHIDQRAPMPGTRFNRQLYRDRYWNESQLSAVRELSDIADSAGIGLLELSLRWVRMQPIAHCILLGASSSSQLRTNLDALAKPPLSSDLCEAVDGVWMTLRGAAPSYWWDWR